MLFFKPVEVTCSTRFSDYHLHPPTLPSSHLCLPSLLLPAKPLPSRNLLTKSPSSLSPALPSPSKKLSSIPRLTSSASRSASRSRWYRTLALHGSSTASICACFARQARSNARSWSKCCCVAVRRLRRCACVERTCAASVAVWFRCGGSGDGVRHGWVWARALRREGEERSGERTDVLWGFFFFFR